MAEQPVRLLKPDGHGIMSQVFSSYSGQSDEAGVLNLGSFVELLTDMGLTATLAADVLSADVFSVSRAPEPFTARPSGTTARVMRHRRASLPFLHANFMCGSTRLLHVCC